VNLVIGKLRNRRAKMKNLVVRRWS